VESTEKKRKELEMGSCGRGSPSQSQDGSFIEGDIQEGTRGKAMSVGMTLISID